MNEHYSIRQAMFLKLVHYLRFFIHFSNWRYVYKTRIVNEHKQ